MESATSFTYNSKLYSFINACRIGDIEQIRQLLSSVTLKEINDTDTDGNTGLHLACIQDNYELASLLLHSDKGKVLCSRRILNKQGLNAYECVRSERIRLLFARPISRENRLVDSNQGVNACQMREVPHTRSDQHEITVPDDWNHGYTSQENALDAQLVLAISRASRLLRKLFSLRTEPEACEVIRNIIRRFIEDKKTYDNLMTPFNRFIQTKKANHLLTLYTKHMTLCEIFQMENNAYTTLLYLYLRTIANRAFGPGETFRGMVISHSTIYQATINEYLWAKQNDEFVLETRAFQSTSKDRGIAEGYIAAYRPENQPSFAILCHYTFPVRCTTALDVQDISQYPDEQEILISPLTLFKVTKIEMISSDYYIISLLNVPVPRMPLRQLWKKMKNSSRSSFG